MKDSEVFKRYETIIHLEHPTSKKHPRMPISDRAAQFAPFAALTGHESAIRETARLTSEEIIPDEQAAMLLNLKINLLCSNLKHSGKIRITYFLPDKKKSGGEYVSGEFQLKRIDECNRVLVMSDGTRIPAERIISLDGEIFELLDE